MALLRVKRSFHCCFLTYFHRDFSFIKVRNHRSTEVNQLIINKEFLYAFVVDSIERKNNTHINSVGDFRSLTMTSMNSEATSTSSDISTNILVLSNIFYPVIDQLSNKDLQSDLRQTFYQLEQNYPGFARRFLRSFIDKEMPTLASTLDIHELTLKIDKFCDKTPYFISATTRGEAEFRELNIRSKNLKLILSRIPDVISDKRQFLDTIKEIASAIKKTLDSVANIYQYFSTKESAQALEYEKKEFIRSSKNFSNTLKAYFRDNQRDEVYIAANNLLVQTDYLLRTIRHFCETKSLDEYLYPLHSQYQQQIRQLNSTRHSSTNNSMGANPRSSANQRTDSTYNLNYN